MSVRQNIRDFLRRAAYGQYERELRRQAAELNDLFLLLCYMEIVGLPNPATLYLLDVYPYLLEQFLWAEILHVRVVPLPGSRVAFRLLLAPNVVVKAVPLSWRYWLLSRSWICTWTRPTVPVATRAVPVISNGALLATTWPRSGP